MKVKWLAICKKTGKRGAVHWDASEFAEFGKLYPKKYFKFRAVWNKGIERK